MTEAVEKSIRELEVEIMYFWVRERERKNKRFEIVVIIFRAYKKCKSSIQKNF